AKFFKTLSFLQSNFEPGNSPFRIALVTARGNPSHERVIRTFRAWDIQIDEAFFMGGIPKDKVLKAFRPHIFFDDQDKNLASVSQVVPSARVPYKE
ncbi:MAG: 5'-nucleotidase, partial [Chloroflexi bacterium]